MSTDVVIVGCGAVLEHLHRAAIDRLRRRGKVNITAVVDLDESLRTRAAGWFEPAVAFSTLSAAMSQNATHVMVLTPPVSHTDLIHEALEYRARVFCEKPLAHDFAATRSLTEHPARRDVSIGMIRRQLDVTDFLRDRLTALVDTCDFRIRTCEGKPYEWPVASERHFRRATGGVGIVRDLGVHVIDFLVWVFGPAVLTDASTDATNEFVARNAALKFEFAGGEAQVKLSWTDPLPTGMTVESRLGTIWVPPGVPSSIFQRLTKRSNWSRLPIAGSGKRYWPGSRRLRCPTLNKAALLQLTDFLGGSTQRLASVEEGAAVLQLIDEST
jgi:predicted dehydrogenase